MARSRRGGRGGGRGRGRGGSGPTTPRQPFNRPNDRSRAYGQDLQTTATPKLSLVEEARWMSSHRSNAFEPGKQLRHLKIEFVSAGCLEGTIKNKDEVDKDEDALLPAPSPGNTHAMAQMSIRSPSPTPSNSSSSSSEDVVVFRGRNAAPLMQAVVSTTTSLPIRAMAAPAVQPVNTRTEGKEATVPCATLSYTSKRATPTPTQAPASSDTLPPTASSSSDNISLPIRQTPAVGGKSILSVATPESDPATDADDVNQVHFEKRLGGKSVWETNTPEWVHRSKPGIGWTPVGERPAMGPFLQGKVTLMETTQDEFDQFEHLYKDPVDAAFEDYKKNIIQFDNDEEMAAAIPASFSRRELDLETGDHNDWESEVSAEIQAQEDGWDADILADLDGMSTSSDVEDIIERILRKRTKKSGVQYLVVYEGSVADDARWFPSSFLKTPRDLELIRIFEAEALSAEKRMAVSSDEGSGSSEDESDDTDEEMELIDDERLARILQKQEELGLSSAERLLFGDDDFLDDPMDMSAILSGHFDRSNKQRRNRARGGKRSQPNFPSASVMADVLDMDPYNGFDVMDTERPSLRPRKKGRRGQMPPELEDSDLNEQLQASWEADRATKRLKKAEREELRKAGLLGRKGKGPDLSVKHKSGFDIHEIKEDIRDFMASETQQLSLPPMEAKWRALIHQKVNKLGLNSKSRGDGHNRFTVLSKTSRTREYDEESFDLFFDGKRAPRSFLHGPLRQGPKGRAIVSYKDGDTVGASAPELGNENKGHALMVKMGWSKGMALGALDNKGILQPIAHVVKTSKAGLQ